MYEYYMYHASCKEAEAFKHIFVLPSEHKAVTIVLFCVISPRLWENFTATKDTHTHSEIKWVLKALK